MGTTDKGEPESRTWGGLRRSSTAELLEWHSVAEGDMPDAETTVLMWAYYPPDPEGGPSADWAAGWWDGEVWRDCASGGVVAGTVTHWAEPEGPAT